jgi:hypothetical protein
MVSRTRHCELNVPGSFLSDRDVDLGICWDIGRNCRGDWGMFRLVALHRDLQVSGDLAVQFDRHMELA